VSLQRVERPTRKQVRQRLLEAAADVLVTHGYVGATVDVITEAAGLSRGALYSNFADKDDLYLELLEDLERQQIDELSTVFAERQSLDRFLDFVAGQRRAPGRDARSLTILQVELWVLALRNGAVRERLAAIQRRSIEATSQLFAGADDRLTATERAAVTIAIGEGLTMKRILDPDLVRDDLTPDVLRYLAELTGLLPRSDG
jgi:AcrR family transcriptional regulator